MLKFIYRRLVYEPYRSLLTCIAMSGALAVILLLEGFHSGLLTQLERVVLNRGADLIVAQSGVTNFVASRSLLPQLSRERIESIAGVVEAHPVTMVPVIYAQPGYRKSPVFFMVYDTAGGPSKLKAGRAAMEPREVVIDESLAVLYDLKVGDPFIVADFEFRIAGVAESASALFTAISFIKYDDMIDFFFDSDLVGDISNLPLLSYLLVDVADGADKEAIARAIEAIEGEGDVFLPEELARNDVALGRTLFGPVLGVLIGAGYIITLLVVGMIMFSAVHGQQRDMGVMKALGFTEGFLVRGVLLESLIMILLAFPLAVLLAIIGAWIIETLVPLYMVEVLDTVPLLRTLFLAMVLSMIAAYIPYRLIARLDPAMVFRG